MRTAMPPCPAFAEAASRRQVKRHFGVQAWGNLAEGGTVEGFGFDMLREWEDATQSELQQGSWT
jgi:hypothetical protein